MSSGSRTFDDDGGLKQFTVGGKKVLDKGVTTDAGANGAITWGRWIEGRVKSSDQSDDDDEAKGKVRVLHYFALGGNPSLPLNRSFQSFASTAPTVTSNSNLVATGAVNAAGGSVDVAFLTVSGGSALYRLVVPVAGQTFSLTGLARQTSAFTFAGTSLITSTGTACLFGCAGTLGGGTSVMGAVGGTAGDRVGVIYGFDSRIGNVSGSIVFKP